MPESGASFEQPLTAPTDKKTKTSKSRGECIGEAYLNQGYFRLAFIIDVIVLSVDPAWEVPADAPKDPRAGRALNIVTVVTLVIVIGWLSWDKLHRERVADAHLMLADLWEGQVNPTLTTYETDRPPQEARRRRGHWPIGANARRFS